MSDAYDFSSIDPTLADVADLSTATAPSFSDWTDLFGGGSSSGAPLVPPTLNLPSTGPGMTDIFRNITGLVQSVYQGEQAVQTAKLQNAIATARLNNQLVTVKTTPNVWAALGLGAVAVFVLALAEKRRPLPLDSDDR